jgi:hypothetical protein
MPTNRRTIERPRRATFTAEALALFRQLEAVPERLRRDNREYRREERRLHDLLGLAGSFICVPCSLLDSDKPLWLEGGQPLRVAEWERIWSTRQQLLDAAAGYKIVADSRKENAPARGDRREVG